MGGLSGTALPDSASAHLLPGLDLVRWNMETTGSPDAELTTLPPLLLLRGSDFAVVTFEKRRLATRILRSANNLP
ncbi:hypothetical protein DFR67_108247 [Williamsia limnetica]|uniref:Uncharacterized protein n=1 Tax=Williamsia limnetica TaxID=882452 RepID=A0A318S0I5_WILLI|nr:hypothetical protein DFR67_108247 [Williamsia limnetica]